MKMNKYDYLWSLIEIIDEKLTAEIAAACLETSRANKKF